MKIVIPCLLIFILFSFKGFSQVSKINIQYFETIDKSKSLQTRGYYSPREQNVVYSVSRVPRNEKRSTKVIKVSRPDSGFDDIYFIDEKENQEYHSMMQTKPMNYMQNRKAYDSFNPNGAESFDEAIGNGIANLLSNWIH